MTTMTMGRA
uniref:Uncharacterized protein MANES_03G049000 n=1 Tax=Rhizophora mucronata TaxID=61149 RepID=A0A2P2PWU7_RHIMU